MVARIKKPTALHRSSQLAVLAAIAFWSGSAVSLPAEDQGAAATSANAQAKAFATAIAHQIIPKQYENVRDWGKKKTIVSGLKVRWEGLRLRTNRRRKEVNHGTWKMYRLSLPNPAEDFQFEVAEIKKLADGKIGMHLVCEARLKTHGRLQQWQRGVRLLSVSVDGQAKVRMTVDCQITMKLDPTKLPPDVLLDPEVTHAKLELAEFRLHRVSRVGGEVAQQVGKGLKHILEDQLEKKRDKLVAKLNRQIDKKRDRLRLSFSDYVAAQWDRHFGKTKTAK